jgi:hypothetical protein
MISEKKTFPAQQGFETETLGTNTTARFRQGRRNITDGKGA